MTLPSDPFEAIAAKLDVFEDEGLTLRAQAMRDPPRGAPLMLEGAAADGGDVSIEPGDWKVADACRKTGLPPACPIVPLGSNGEEFCFLNTLGQVHLMKASSFGKGPIEALFQGRSGYLEWAWPRWAVPRSAKLPPYVKGYEADEARMCLINACGFKGTFELEDRVRGRGAWRDDDGSLIYHAGDAVMIGGVWVKPGEHGRHIYPSRPKIGRPAKRAWKGKDGESVGELLMAALESWNWDRGELDARLALGWAVTAKIGGALTQRPVTYVTGAEGSGKSTLQTFLRLLMNGAMVATSNTTQAGIYQRVRQDSVAVMVDEMEAKEDTRTTDKIIELARIAYSGDKMQRGGKDGTGTEFTVMNSFLFSSIARPPIDSQDASRIAMLVLRHRVMVNAAGEAARDVLAELGMKDGETVGKLGQALLKRCFDWFPRWDALVAAYRAALVAGGHTDRSADTFGTLWAGWHVAVHDDMPDVLQLEMAGRYLAAERLEETAGKEATWQRCWWHLMDVPAEGLRQNNATPSVGQILNAWRKDCAEIVAVGSDLAELRKQAKKVDDQLQRVGMALSFAKGADPTFENARLFVPPKHPAVYQLFEGTAWAGRLGQPGPWHGVLKQMPPEFFSEQACDKLLNKSMRGLMIDLAKAVG